jgi:hypothetical protein
MLRSLCIVYGLWDKASFKALFVSVGLWNFRVLNGAFDVCSVGIIRTCWVNSTSLTWRGGWTGRSRNLWRSRVLVLLVIPSRNTTKFWIGYNAWYVGFITINSIWVWLWCKDYFPGQYTLNSLHEAYRRLLLNHSAGTPASVVRLLGASQIIDGTSRFVNTVTPAKKAWPVILHLLNANQASEPLTVDFPLCRIHPAGFRQPALRSFLSNPFLSGDFYVDLEAHQEYMTLCCFAVLQQGGGKRYVWKVFSDTSTHPNQCSIQWSNIVCTKALGGASI